MLAMFCDVFAVAGAAHPLVVHAFEADQMAVGQWRTTTWELFGVMILVWSLLRSVYKLS